MVTGKKSWLQQAGGPSGVRGTAGGVAIARLPGSTLAEPRQRYPWKMSVDALSAVTLGGQFARELPELTVPWQAE